MPEDVHAHSLGLGPLQVVVERRDLDTAFNQLHHHRADLGFRQHEIAHHHDIVIAHGFECEPRAECQGRFELHPVKSNFQVRTRQPDPIDAP